LNARRVSRLKDEIKRLNQRLREDS
jgi:hypothetical protein